MSNKSSKKIGLLFVVTALFIFSSFSQLVLGFSMNVKNDSTRNDDFQRYFRHYFPETYALDEKDYLILFHDSIGTVVNHESEIISKASFVEIEKNKNPQILKSGGPMDSPWPMYCHDIHHTGISLYSTAENPLDEKWRFKLTGHSNHCSPIIDNEGIIYIARDKLYSIYPDGTQKWMYDITWPCEIAPAISDNGIIYVGTIWAMPNYLYAIHSNDGTLKWKYQIGDSITSSPAVADDGTIYTANWNGDVFAINSDGTLKWTYHTGDVVTGSPAIGLDGEIYIGSHDNYVYAFTDDGIVKWKFNTGNWVHGSATIGTDGTVYIGSDNNYLYALNPDYGTVKWQMNIGSIWGSPTLAKDGTIYTGVFQEKFYAINPDGTVKWSYNTPGRIWFGSSAAVSADGIIYFGTTPAMEGKGGKFIALNHDGTERWIFHDGWYETSPAIGHDGTIFAVSSHGDEIRYGYLHAFGELDPNAPGAPTINGPNSGVKGEEYDFTFTSVDPKNVDIYYYVDFGDGTIKDWVGPYNSGEELKIAHTFNSEGTYTIKARAKNTNNLWGPWGELEVTMPRIKILANSLLMKLLEQFSNIFLLMKYLLGI